MISDPPLVQTSGIPRLVDGTLLGTSTIIQCNALEGDSTIDPRRCPQPHAVLKYYILPQILKHLGVSFL